MISVSENSIWMAQTSENADSHDLAAIEFSHSPDDDRADECTTHPARSSMEEGG